MGLDGGSAGDREPEHVPTKQWEEDIPAAPSLPSELALEGTGSCRQSLTWVAACPGPGGEVASSVRAVDAGNPICPQVQALPRY